MKNSLKYFKLWQKKRDELQINDNQQTDWLSMQSLLETHLPTSGNQGIKKASEFKFKVLKMLPKVLISFSAAAMIYTASHIVLKKIHQHNGKHKIHSSQHLITDSLTHNSLTTDSTIVNDSLLSASQPGRNTDSIITTNDLNKKPFTGTSPGNNLDGRSIDKTNTSASTLSLNKNQPAAGSSVVDKTMLGNGTNTATALGNKIAPDNKPTAASLNNKVVSDRKNGATSSIRNNAISGNGRSAVKKLPNDKTVLANKHGAIVFSGNRAATGKTTVLMGNKTKHDNSPASTTKNIRELNHHHSNLHQYANYQSQTANKKAARYYSNNKKDDESILDDNRNNENQNLLATAPRQNLKNLAQLNYINSILTSTLQMPAIKSSTDKSKSKNKKDKSIKESKSSKIDWGILGGVNTSGSFTSSKQNANFYGSSPVDAYFGLFATYNLNDKWGVGLQTQFYSPQNAVTVYSHANQSTVDSNQNLQITASRKVYAFNIPIHIIYRVADNFSVMAGPVIGIPVKQINTNSVPEPYTIRADSAYFAKISNILNQTNYEQKLNMGITAGAGFQYKRLLFEASYLKSLSGYTVSSALGTYRSNSGTFQFTIGFKIGKAKP